nr:MAG TPA: hypothetical protein [Caudoviricetes sp.]DAH64147.1 MAG TPA: hypothetical protein [Caudoviricetes sp.]DAP20224.1 MAG TPA: hypothetical protein [Caudoviricetes sp.]DAZ08452.1 MAG TPA: hypothetical protein [Caudoviricetes sp.]
MHFLKTPRHAFLRRICTLKCCQPADIPPKQCRIIFQFRPGHN